MGGAAPPTKKANTHSKAAQHAANKAAHARATKRVHELSKKAGIKVRSAVPKKAADAAYDKYQLHERQQKRKHMFPPVKTKEQAVKRAYEVMQKSRRTEKRNKALHKHTVVEKSLGESNMLTKASSAVKAIKKKAKKAKHDLKKLKKKAA